MPVIINGEVVQDSDPRAVQYRARHGNGSGNNNNNNNGTRRGGRGNSDRQDYNGNSIATWGSRGGGRGRSSAAAPPTAGRGQAETGGRVNNNNQPWLGENGRLAALTGLTGASISIPAIPILSVPPSRLAVIHLLLTAGLWSVLGWRSLIAGAALHFLTQRQGGGGGGNRSTRNSDNNNIDSRNNQRGGRRGRIERSFNVAGLHRNYGNPQGEGGGGARRRRKATADGRGGGGGGGDDSTSGGGGGGGGHHWGSEGQRLGGK